MQPIATIALAMLFGIQGLSMQNRLDESPYSEEQSAKLDELSERIEMIWDPAGSVFPVSHVDLSINGTVWRADWGYGQRSRSLQKIKADVSNTNEDGLFIFVLRISKQELAALELYLLARVHQKAYQTCICGLSKALNKTTGIHIPLPFSQVPSLAALYLKGMCALGHPRVQDVTFIGNDAAYSLFSSSEINILIVPAISLVLNAFLEFMP